MEAERLYTKQPSRTIQQKHGGEGAFEMVDNRPAGILQAMSGRPIQRVEDDEDTLQGKFAQPIQSTLENIIQRKFDGNKITFKSQTLRCGFRDYLVGKEMNANFDNSAKSVPIGSDTSSTSALAPLMAYLKYEFGSHKFLKGHLLNHDMGGPAWAVNLFPITYRANSEHKNHVELPVEFLLHNLATNQYLSYSVIVDNVMVDKGEPRCEFKCIWGIYDKFTDYKVMQQNDTIVSKLTNNAKKRKSSLMRLTGADRKKYLKIWGHLNNTFDEKKILDIALFNGRKYKNMEKLKYGF